MSAPVKVTVSDSATGEVLGERIVDDDYVLVCAGRVYLAHTQRYTSGTTILTIKKNPNQGGGADPDRTEGEDAPLTAADAGIGGPHECVDGRVGHDHAGVQGEPKPATEGDRESDPPGATYSPNEIFQAACEIRDGAVITSMGVALALIDRLHSNRVEAGA